MGRWLTNSRDLLVMILEAGSLRSRCQHHQVTSVSQISILSHVMVGARELCEVPVLNINLINKDSTHMT